jgi:hypothetical protein
VLMCPINRCGDAPRERAVHLEGVLAMQSGCSWPPPVLSNESLGSDPRPTYDVDFDDFFVLHLLDEVVACVEDTNAVLREEIERV